MGQFPCEPKFYETEKQLFRGSEFELEWRRPRCGLEVVDSKLLPSGTESKDCLESYNIGTHHGGSEVSMSCLHWGSLALQGR